MINTERITFSIPEEVDRQIIYLWKNDSRFERCFYSEIVRRVLDHGIELAGRKERT